MMRRVARVVILLLFAGSASAWLIWADRNSRNAQDRQAPSAAIVKTVLDKSTPPGLVSRAVLLSQSHFDAATAEAVARQFVSETDGAVLAELIMGFDEPDLRKSISGAMPRPESEPTFCETLDQLGAASGSTSAIPVTPAARIFRVGDSALFSYRLPEPGNRERPGLVEAVLRGEHDPTKMRVNGNEYRLLTFDFRRFSDRELNVALYFKSTQVPRCSDCENLARAFQSRLRAQSLKLHIRRDVWFPDAPFLVFRFEPDNVPGSYERFGRIVPPTVTQFYDASRLACSLDADRFTCLGHGVYEQVPQQGGR